MARSFLPISSSAWHPPCRPATSSLCTICRRTRSPACGGRSTPGRQTDLPAALLARLQSDRAPLCQAQSTAAPSVGDVEPALGKKILDISIAEREAQVEPDGLLTTGGN